MCCLVLVWPLVRLIQPTKLSTCSSETALFERMWEEVGMPQWVGRACLSVGETCPVQPSGSAFWIKELLSEVAVLVILSAEEPGTRDVCSNTANHHCSRWQWWKCSLCLCAASLMWNWISVSVHSGFLCCMNKFAQTTLFIDRKLFELNNLNSYTLYVGTILILYKLWIRSWCDFFIEKNQSLVPFGSFCRKALTFEDFGREQRWFRLEIAYLQYSHINWCFSDKVLWYASVPLLHVFWIVVGTEIINKT